MAPLRSFIKLKRLITSGAARFFIACGFCTQGRGDEESLFDCAIRARNYWGKMATAATQITVTPEIAAEHGLTAEEYARVKQILGRDLNITELGILSVMWSSHCSYKSSKAHLKRLPTRGKLVVQGQIGRASCRERVEIAVGGGT